MGQENDGSDASSESGFSALTEANLAAHDRLFQPKPDDDFLQQPASLSPSLSGDEVDGGIFARGIIEDRSDQGESVARSLHKTSDGSVASESSGYGSDAEQSEPASRHGISASSPLTPGSFTLQSAFLPFAQGASAIQFVNIDRAVSNVVNGWAKGVNVDGEKTWEQMLMDASGELKKREFKDVELTRNRRLEGRLGGLKSGAHDELVHPWAHSQWINNAAKKLRQAAFDAAKPVDQPDLSSLLSLEQDADGA